MCTVMSPPRVCSTKGEDAKKQHFFIREQEDIMSSGRFSKDTREP